MRARASAALLLALAALAGGCGADSEGDPIPRSDAAALLGQLDNLETRLAESSAEGCREALSVEVNQLQSIVNSLPEDVDAEVRDALQRSLDRLVELVDGECDELEQGETETETTPTETIPPETETTPTETIPPETETTPTETIPPETEPTPTAPDEGDDGSGGAGVPGEDG